MLATAPAIPTPGPLVSASAPDDCGLLAPGRLVLLEGGRVDAVLFRWVAREAARGDVLFLDGGNSLDVPKLAEAARRQRLPVEDVLRTVRVARGFTAHQWAALLDAAPSLVARDTRLVVASAFPELYLDEDVGAAEGRVLARRGAEGLRALARAARVPVLLTNRGAALTPYLREMLLGLADEAALLRPAGVGSAEAYLAKARAAFLLPLEGRQRLLSEYVPARTRADAPRADAGAPGDDAAVGVA